MILETRAKAGWPFKGWLTGDQPCWAFLENVEELEGRAVGHVYPEEMKLP